ncbi:MAG TPA: PilN domain-containing protein [Candidatus Acidoferrum sp.]|nr:PilN domain-containing protein [Candidatus Acidoferrum sp.]
MRVRLNLATKPLVTHRRFLVGAAAVAAVGAIVFISLGWHVYGARKAAAATQARMQALRAEQLSLESRRDKLDLFFKRSENAKLAERAAYLNSIIDESSFLWTQMFMDIERVKPGGVRLLSISPKMVKGNMEVHLRVGAQSDEAKLKFLRALEGSKAFEKVMLLNSQLATQAGDQQVFEISVIYTRA